jgi:hypothetical protein
MTYVDLSSTSVPAVEIIKTDANREKDSIHYLLAFSAVGLFFSILSFALTPTEYLLESTAALAPQMQTVVGLRLSEIEIPAGLKLAEYSAH